MNTEINTQAPTEKQIKSVENAIDHFKNGKMVIIVDDEGRENEGDIALPAQDCKPEDINFMATVARGLICTPLDGSIIDNLDLEPMVTQNTESMGTAFTVSVDASNDIESGISAKDRSNTVKKLANKNSSKSDFVKPGHIFPLRYQNGGVLVRAGHTEGSVDLVKLSGKIPAAVICEVMNEDGRMARLDDLHKFAIKHKIKIASIEDIIAYRLRNEKFVYKASSKDIKINKNDLLDFSIYKSKISKNNNYVIIKGKISSNKLLRVRVISTMLKNSKSVFQNSKVKQSLKYLSKHTNFALIIINNENMKDKFENENITLRYYGIGAQIIKDLRIKNMILVTRTKKKIIGLEGFGLKIKKQEIIK